MGCISLHIITAASMIMLVEDLTLGCEDREDDGQEEVDIREAAQAKLCGRLRKARLRILRSEHRTVSTESACTPSQQR
jgi:hypothetical protein